MVGPLAACAACGHRFAASQAFNFGQASNITFEDVSINCPRCDGPARVLDGTFNFRDEMVEVLAAPGWTIQQLRELKDVLIWAQATLPTDPDGVLRRVTETDGRVGDLLQRRVRDGWTKDDTWKLIMAILAVVTIIVAVMGQRGGVSEEDVRRIVDQQLEQRDLHSG